MPLTLSHWGGPYELRGPIRTPEIKNEKVSGKEQLRFIIYLVATYI